MKLRSRINYFGMLGTGIFLVVILSGLVCHGVTVAADSDPDKAAVQDCLFKALETAPDGTTIDELRAQCQAETLTGADTEDESLLASRIYTDADNVLRPFTLMAHRPNYILMVCYNNSPNDSPWLLRTMWTTVQVSPTLLPMRVWTRTVTA